MSVQLDGGGLTTVVSGAVDVGFAIDSTWLYWVGTLQGDAGSESMAVMKSLLDGGDPTVIVTVSEAPELFSVDPDWLYWTVPSSAGIANGSVMKVLLDGGGLSTLASNLEFPLGIAVDSTNVYFTFYSEATQGGGIMSVQLDGGGLTNVASGPWYPEAIAIDANNVYLAGEGSLANNGILTSAEVSCQHDGGGLRILAADPSNSLAVNATSLFWVTDFPDGGAIVELTPK
jgi:hypothetical protein